MRVFVWFSTAGASSIQTSSRRGESSTSELETVCSRHCSRAEACRRYRRLRVDLYSDGTPETLSLNVIYCSPSRRLLKLDQPATAKKTSYGEILKSTALVGGSSALNIGIGIIRTKAMAMLLGPAGFGLMGLYSSIVDLAQSVAAMGVNSSGVRQIAEAAGSDDKERIARTATVLKRVSVVLGVLGALLLILVSPQASALTFGNRERTGAVALLSIAVFLKVLSGGQGALIQGMRQIASLAKMNVLGAAFGSLATIPIVYFYREHGVVPSLIAIGAASLAVSWWYSRDIDVPAVSIPPRKYGTRPRPC